MEPCNEAPVGRWPLVGLTNLAEGDVKALIAQGGWEGHRPKQVAETIAKALRGQGFDVEVSEALDMFSDVEELKALDVIVPIWTMGTKEEGRKVRPVLEAVKSGVGIAASQCASR